MSQSNANSQGGHGRPWTADEDRRLENSDPRMSWEDVSTKVFRGSRSAYACDRRYVSLHSGLAVITLTEDLRSWTILSAQGRGVTPPPVKQQRRQPTPKPNFSARARSATPSPSKAKAKQSWRSMTPAQGTRAQSVPHRSSAPIRSSARPKWSKWTAEERIAVREARDEGHDYVHISKVTLGRSRSVSAVKKYVIAHPSLFSDDGEGSVGESNDPMAMSEVESERLGVASGPKEKQKKALPPSPFSDGNAAIMRSAPSSPSRAQQSTSTATQHSSTSDELALAKLRELRASFDAFKAAMKSIRDAQLAALPLFATAAQRQAIEDQYRAKRAFCIGIFRDDWIATWEQES